MATWIDVEEEADYSLPSPAEVQARRAGFLLEMAVLLHRDLAPDASRELRVRVTMALQAVLTVWATVIQEGGA
jgi:hypothetical protein